jgi:ADP-ribose pyrophosphatase
LSQKRFSVEIVESRTAYQGRRLHLVEEQIKLPDGHISRMELIRHPGAVVIVPIKADGKLLLTSQYRHAIQNTILEFPAGTLEPNEEPLACAKREIAEEVGFGANQWTDVGSWYPGPGFCDELQICFVASDLYEHKLPGDDDELIEVVELDVDEVGRLIDQGEIVDAKSIAAFLLASRKGLISPS